MSKSSQSYGPRFPWLKTVGYHLSRPVINLYAKYHRFYQANHAYAVQRAAEFRERLNRGETLYLVGLGVGGHNSGTALIRASQREGIRFLANNEEERFTQVKHCTDLPGNSLEVLKQQLSDHGLRPQDVHAYVGSWNYVEYTALGCGELLSEMPESWVSLRCAASPTMNGAHFFQGMKSPPWVSRQLGLAETRPLIGLRHHDNHAYFPYAVSPFAQGRKPTLVAIIDGSGDDGSITFYRGEGPRLEVIYNNRSMFESFALGVPSSQFGPGRLDVHEATKGQYMAAAALGNQNRLTNPFTLNWGNDLFPPQGQRYLISNGPIAKQGPLTQQKNPEIVGPGSLTKWNPTILISKIPPPPSKRGQKGLFSL